MIFDTLADSRNNGFNLMMNDGKQQSTFLFTITRNTPENRHEQVFHDL
ncbi:exonuclease domain protein [Escherichia coli EC1846]|nr:exonuclease domain protein [Escherichia coli EC1846]EKI80159.1 exonuclease domain protein [Escherichia coli EC1847]